ncbi:MAG: hypothetical protein CMLOHMNK_01828 [Steroidobacteraceae bacterium]|nr:hypothetical protein [Steroidobacteraceae bacterium]
MNAVAASESLSGDRDAPHEAPPIERPLGTVNRERSWGSRLSAIFALLLLLSIGGGLLVWYYSGLLAKQREAASAQSASTQKQAQGEMILPPLGPLPQSSSPQATPASSAPAADAMPSGSPSSTWAGSIVGAPPPMPIDSPLASASATGAPALPPALVRQLGGSVFASGASLGSLPMGDPALEHMAGGRPMTEQTSNAGPALPHSALQEALNVPPTELRFAQRLPPRQWLLGKGAFIDCTLETAIDSSLPGMTTCITAVDTFSADGTLVLLERGTKLIGETRGEVQRGTARVFVAWSEARTPSGVVVPLASPGTDSLGRSGLEGAVDRHFWERFGAAMLISVVEGAIQIAVAEAQGGDGNTVIYSPRMASDVMTEILKDTVNIPSTVRKAHGEAIQVLVARDIDFRGVYELARR